MLRNLDGIWRSLENFGRTLSVFELKDGEVDNEPERESLFGDPLLLKTTESPPNEITE